MIKESMDNDTRNLEVNSALHQALSITRTIIELDLNEPEGDDKDRAQWLLLTIDGLLDNAIKVNEGRK